jgi:microcystin-dependent protein
MRKLFTILAALLLTASVFSQAPQKMSYQAVIRNSSNALVTSTAVGMKISIFQGSTTGTPVYVETQIPSTNANGLVTIEIGGGTGFNTIDWANGPFYIKTETDPTGGTNYTITGTSQLLSVPYALYAASGGIPSGTIVPFGGTNIPTGWLLCDGTLYVVTQYPNLYAAIGINYGGILGANFNVPDLRGRFLRGVDGTAGNDPDNATRTTSNTGGNTGDNVGSLQNDAFQGHYHKSGGDANHRYTPYATTWDAGAGAVDLGNFFTLQPVSDGTNGTPRTTSETRPKNVYVNYIIKY